MQSCLYTELEWLPKAPADFKRRCEALASTAGAAPGNSIRELASCALSNTQLTRLAGVIQALRDRKVDCSPLMPFKLGIVSNATTKLIVPALVASAARHGILLECVEAEYDQVMQSALDPASALNQARCHAVLLAVDHRGLPFGNVPLGDAQAESVAVQAALGYVKAIRAGFRSHGDALSIVQTIARPPETLFGSLDRSVKGSWIRVAESYNRGLSDELAGGDLLLDVANIAETVGLARWHDPTQWNLAKLPFASEMVPLYADHLGRLVSALRGKSRRGLVLDLDNTLWSGVIGDDGMDGIVVGQNNPTGEAHLQLQQGAARLRERGIVLAVSSKNNEDIARRPFREHPDMTLRDEHIAVFKANWDDKATNITAIARELSLGLDAFVFVDDNPFERNFVRQSVPAVAVPEMPEDAAYYWRTLAASGLFETIAFSAEDRARAEFYQRNSERIALQERVGDLQQYLASLGMEIFFSSFDAVGRSRIAQLVSKSNQFNLTTRRYSEAEIQALEHDCDAFTMQVRLSDRFGDNGMISVIICRRQNQDWLIDTWLMSCRVLGRCVEQAVLNEIVANARERGVRRIIGQYIPTERNALVRDHYRNLKFVQQTGTDHGTTVWELDVAGYAAPPIPMVIHGGKQGSGNSQ